MFRYANPYDFEPRVAEGDQVDYMDIVQGVDEFDGQDVETEGWRLNSMLWCTCQTSFLLQIIRPLPKVFLTFLFYNLHEYVHNY